MVGALPVKRAPLVYGKQSSNNPLTSHTDEQASSQPLGLARHASDMGRSPSPDAFQFGFRHRLKELDEQFDDHGTQPEPGMSSDNGAACGGLSQVKDPQGISMGTAILSSEGSPSSGGLPRASLSPSLASLCATSTQEHSPDSPPVHRRTRVPNPTLSDLEAEDPSSSSSVSPVRHTITTPYSHSSPTPPTSGEIPMVSRNAKGKAPARDVLPLLFDDERPPAAEVPSKPKKGRRSALLARPETKAPTKRERREAAFESSRIAASRPVEVTRTQEQKHSLAALFAGLRRDNIATAALGTELPSDPIERFSSPIDKQTQAQPLNNVFGSPSGLLRTSVSTHAQGTTSQSSSSGKSKAFLPAVADSDDEMPSVASIIQQGDQRLQKLRAIKQVALQHTDMNMAIDSSGEDDDLLIVEDDMHSVVRQEAVERRLGKVHSSPTKDRSSLRRITRPSFRPAVIPPCTLSKQELQELAKPSFARIGKRAKNQLNKMQLDQMMIVKHTEEQLKSIKRQEDEWVKKGGRLSRDAGADASRNSLSQTLETYAQRGLRVAEMANATGDETSTNESDDDYQSSASPGPVMASDTQDNTMGVPRLALDGLDDDEVITLRYHKRGQQCSRAVIGSDDEGAQPVQSTLYIVQKDSASSMESQTEDENDKENSAKLMYDRSEDKENKAIVRHEPSLPELAIGSSLGFLHGDERDTQGNPSLASPTDLSDIIGLPKGNVRSPLKDISKDENDLLLSFPPEARLLQSVTMPSPCITSSALGPESPPTLQNERINWTDGPSLDSGNNEGGLVEFIAPQPSFLERLQSQANSEQLPVALNPFPNSGFSQFSAEDQGSRKSVVRTENDGLSLTLDVGPKPALEVSSILRQKAENIFEKEQEYVVAAAIHRDEKPKERLYVNDHGFLTQTRPEGPSPQIYRMTPSLATKFMRTQDRSPQTRSLNTRSPLRTLSFTESQGPSLDSQPLRRLRRRSLSPLERRTHVQDNNPVSRPNAFNILCKVPTLLSKAKDTKHGKSEFVAVEAEESDEDDTFGFGAPKEEEEEENNEQDKIVEGLVDDAFMDAETEAVDLVQEKFREHEEEDDRQLQKLHEDATKGKFRTRRRGREVGFEDDSGEEEEEEERRIRQRIHKKRKIEGDNLEALGQNVETRAFYDTYHQDLLDEDDEFGYLRETTSFLPEDEDARAEEPQETVPVDEIRKCAREVAQNNYEVEVLDPEDTSWVDRAMVTEVDDPVCVKLVECRGSRPIVHRPNAGQMDFGEERSARHKASEQERKQMMSWAKNQSHRHQNTGRTGNTTAVTGHAKAKSGGGSLRSTQPSKSASSTARKTNASSLLSTVSNRNGKFA